MTDQTMIERLKEKAETGGEVFKDRVIEHIEPGKAIVKYEDEVVYLVMAAPVVDQDICGECLKNKRHSFTCSLQPQVIIGIFTSENEAKDHAQAGSIINPIVPGYKLKDFNLWAWRDGTVEACPAKIIEDKAEGE